jgi:hypothetical protein
MANYKKCYLETIKKLEDELEYITTQATPDDDYELGFLAGIKEMYKETLLHMYRKVVDLDHE